ncbi:MAG TPA: GAF domain-containing protein [Thermodesulfobacteriota bacterium]|nr:GAF domain-containing protein [Thermodesulfobacteriota bacterium]
MEKKYKRSQGKKGLLQSEAGEVLRRRAPRLLDYEPAKVDDFSKADLSSLIHELRVYQAELEIQNEELRRIQLELEESCNKYLDLYNFAPVGYFTLNARTIILDVNLAGAELLRAEKQFLIGKRFTRYIAHKNHDVFYSYRKRLLKTNTRESCELQMLRNDGATFYSRLDSVAVFNSEGNFVHFRIAILDITEQRQSKEKLDKALDELEIRVKERTSQLLKTNEALRVEISNRVKVEEELKKSLDYISKRNRYESIMSHVTQAVHKSINLQEVLENAVESMIKNIRQASHIGIYLVEGEWWDSTSFPRLNLVTSAQGPPTAVLKAHRGFPDWFVEQTGRIPYPKGYTWKAILEGKALYCGDVERDTIIGPAGKQVGTKSYLSTPIFFGDKTIGCVNINSLQKHAFDEEDIKLMEAVTKQIGVALTRAKQAKELKALNERLNERNKDLEVVNAITQAINQSFDLQQIYRVALNKILELENVDAVMVYVIDEEKDEAVLQAHVNLPEDYIRRAGRIPYPKGLTWKAINAGRVINIEDAQKDPDTGPAGRDLGLRGSLGIPIFLKEKVIGVIWFAAYKEHKFNEKEIGLLSAVGNQIAIAIAKTEQYRELSRKNRYEPVVGSVTRAVHQSIDLQDVLENAVEAMSEEIEGIDNVGIYLVEEEEAVMRAYRGYPGWFVERLRRIPYPKGFTWKTIIEGKPIYCADTDQDTIIGQAGRDLGTKSYAAMPIRFQDETVGVININSLKKNAFRKEELKLLEIIAQQIEIAINNAQKAEALRESEKRFRSMADAAPVMIWMSGVDKLWSYVNKGWLEFTGRTLEQELGSSWAENLHPDDQERCLDTYFAAFNARQEFEMEYRLKRFDGEYRWVLDKGVPRFLPDGRFVGFMGSCIDITERKNAEERLNNYARQLQSLSHRLMSVQEIERRFLAKELHDEIGQVLTVVKIHLQALRGLGENDSYITHLKESMSVVDKALRQVRDLSLNLRPSMLDDLGLVATLRWYINQQAQLGGFVGEFNASPENMRFEPNLETVCFRTAQEALTNVLRHANAKRVSVELRQHDSMLELVIRDDGIGFDLDAVQERMARGLSFGLLSMQERVQLVGGRIEIKTKPNKGTMIRAYFPLSFES